MVKYSFDFKQNVVQEYLSGQGGIRSITEKYSVKSAKDVRKWINAYKQFGSSGIQRKRQNMAYSPQFKLNTVNLYLTSEKSYQEVANEVGINNPSLISQ